MAPFERAMVISYRLSIVTVELSLTIRPQFGRGLSCAKKNRVDIFSRLSTMHERDKQTDKTDHGTV